MGNSGDLGADGRIKLNCFLINKTYQCELDSSGSGYEPLTSSCENGSEPLGFRKGGEFD